MTREEIEARRATAAAARKAATDAIIEIDSKLQNGAQPLEMEEKMRLRTRRFVLEQEVEAQDKAITAAEQDLLVAAGIVNKGPTVKRSTFDGMTQIERRDFLKQGGRIDDDPAPVQKTGPAGANLIRRSDFDAMSQPERAAAMKDGKRVVD